MALALSSWPRTSADEGGHPVRLVGVPLRIDRLVGRQLAGMAARGADDRVLPDLLVVGQRLDVLGRLLLVLAVLEQRAAGRPEHRRALAVGELRQRAEVQLLRIVPVLRHAQRRVEVLVVVADALGGEGDLVRRSVDAAVRGALEQDVRDWRSAMIFFISFSASMAASLVKSNRPSACRRLVLMLWVIGASERQPCESKVAPNGAAPESTIVLARPGSRPRSRAPRRAAGLGGQARMPAGADHVEQERPAIDLAVDQCSPRGSTG